MYKIESIKHMLTKQRHNTLGISLFRKLMTIFITLGFDIVVEFLFLILNASLPLISLTP